MSRHKLGVHDGLVSELEEKLFHSKNYSKTWKFLEYNHNGQVGEIDLLAYDDKVYDFYEVKCNRTKKSVKKAHEQYERFKKAYPHKRTNGFLYTGNKGLEFL